MSEKKKRIRYSELAPSPPTRASTPVEIARALAEVKPNLTVAPSEHAVVLGEASVILGDAKDLLSPSRDEKQVPRPAQDDNRSRPEDTHAEFLMFRVGAEWYAGELARIEEVIDQPVIHFVPEMPAAMLGVISVRGRFVHVYSPSAALNVPLGERGAVLVFRHATGRTGILADDVEDAISVDLRTLQFPHDAGAGRAVVVGVARHDGRLVSLVDADSLLAACRSASLAGVP